MESKEWSERLGKIAKLCLIGFFGILIIAYLLFPTVYAFVVKNNILGMRSVLGCDPKDYCCLAEYSKTGATEYQTGVCQPGGQCIEEAMMQLCTSNRYFVSIFSMLLFILGIASYVLSWLLKPKKGKPGIIPGIISWLTEPK